MNYDEVRETVGIVVSLFPGTLRDSVERWFLRDLAELQKFLLRKPKSVDDYAAVTEALANVSAQVLVVLKPIGEFGERDPRLIGFDPGSLKLARAKLRCCACWMAEAEQHQSLFDRYRLSLEPCGHCALAPGGSATVPGEAIRCPKCGPMLFQVR